MARRCEISGKGPQFGHRVSHAKNRTKHTFEANLQVKRIYIPEEKRFVRMRVSARMLRTIDKLGLKTALKKNGLSLAALQ